MRSPGPARRRRALLPAGRHRLRSALVRLYSTWQSKSGCTVRFWDATPFSISSSQELCRSTGVVPGGSTTWFPEYLLLGWTPKQAPSFDRESPGGVPKRGDCDSRPSASFDHRGFARPGNLRVGHRNRRDYLERMRPRSSRISRRRHGEWRRIFHADRAGAVHACAGTTICWFRGDDVRRGEVTLPFSALWTSARAVPASPSSDGEARRYCLPPVQVPAICPARRRHFRRGAPRTA
jgi:hypothetical protein